MNDAELQKKLQEHPIIVCDESELSEADRELFRRVITGTQPLPESARRRVFVISGDQNSVRRRVFVISGNDNIQAEGEEPAGSHEDWRRLNE
jgi:hypothetical protein